MLFLYKELIRIIKVILNINIGLAFDLHFTIHVLKVIIVLKFGVNL